MSSHHVASCQPTKALCDSALALVALGYRSLSVSPSALGPIKSMLLDLDAAKAGELLNELIEANAPRISVRGELSAFAAAEGLQF